MARRTKVVTICDRHRGEVDAAGTVEITIGGERRKLDLCADHLAELRKAMRPWLRQATAKGGARKSGRPSQKGTARSSDAAVVRAWALEQGYALAERGRIPTDVREAFSAAR